MKNILLFLIISGIIFSKESLIEKYYIFDYLTKECLNCDGTEDMEKLRAIINFRDSDEIKEWLFERFDSKNNIAHFELKRKDKTIEEKYNNPSFFISFSYLTSAGGFYYDWQNYRLKFIEKSCFLFPYVDGCIQRYLELYDFSRYGRLWKRKIPFFYVPIYPFIIKDYIIYIGDGDYCSACIIIINKKNGKIIEEFGIEKEYYEEHRYYKFSFSDGSNPYDKGFHCPYYKDGYIYVESSSNSWIDEQTGELKLEKPHKIYLIKVKF